MIEDGNYKRVAETKTGNGHVSTVWLGLDHSFNIGKGRPIIFETMVFGGSFDGEQERYSTEEEALAGHASMVTKIGGDSSKRIVEV